MQFIFPLFLGAAALISVPILIHLFYFRRFKKVYFTNVRFLKELKEETSSRSRIRNLLVLLMRIMAILFLVFAFAQPFIKKGDEAAASRRIVGVFIDNSFSMSAQSEDVPLLDVALQRAREIISAYDETDRFVIRSNDALGRFDRMVDKNTALEFIEEIEISASSTPHSQVLEYLENMVNKDNQADPTLYIISDFQKSQADLPDSTASKLYLVPVKPVQERNLSIDSVWFESPVILPGQVAKLVVQSRNYDDNPAENIKVGIKYAGESKPIGNIQVPANGVSTDTLALAIKGTGWQHLTLEISDYPIVFDDTFHLAFEVPKELPVMVIQDGEPSRFVRAAFESNPYYAPKYQKSDRVSYAEIPAMRMIVLQDVRTLSSGLASELTRYLESGGSVIYFPPGMGNWQEVNTLLRSLGAAGASGWEEGSFESSRLNVEHFIYKDVFERIPENLKLPSAKKRYRLTSGKAETILQYRDGLPMLLNQPIGSGNLYISSIHLNPEHSNLATSAEIFIPLLFRAPLQQNEFTANAYQIGLNEPIEIRMHALRGDMQLQINGPSSFIPTLTRLGTRTFINTHQQVVKDGIYALNTTEKQELALLAFHYNRKESNPKCFDSGELSNSFANYEVLSYEKNLNLAAVIRAKAEGIHLWRWALIFGILFILAEILILRFWKV
jgi:hypothetical protein